MAQFMVDMLVLTMPYMKPVAYAGTAAAALALVLAASHALLGAGGGVAGLAAKFAIAVGLFFLACEIAGRLLGMEPTLLFSADPFDREMFRNQWPFWSLGAALVVAGAASRWAGHKSWSGMS